MATGTDNKTELPPLRDLLGKTCPDCGTGIVTITAYDPDATHEKGENAAILGDRATGGSFAWRCENCGHTGSVGANDLGSWTEAGPFAGTSRSTSSSQRGK
jgi:predicted RNA-binding Zn-ribbon protein involved in translation (DUF1610 family)